MRCHLQLLAHSRYATRQRPHHPVPRQRDTRIRRHGERVRRPRRATRRQGNPPLVGIDRVRRARHANHAERIARLVGGDGECATHGDTAGRNAVDDRTGGEAAVVGVEVWRIVDLRVEMIRGAAAAETAATVDHGTVGHKERSGVVVARNGDRSHLGEGGGVRIEDFGGELGRVVGEWNGGDLTTDDQDGAVGEDDPVGKGASVRHGADGCNGRSGGRCA